MICNNTKGEITSTLWRQKTLTTTFWGFSLWGLATHSPAGRLVFGCLVSWGLASRLRDQDLELATHGPAGGLSFEGLVSGGFFCGGVIFWGLVISATRFGACCALTWWEASLRASSLLESILWGLVSGGLVVSTTRFGAGYVWTHWGASLWRSSLWRSSLWGSSHWGSSGHGNQIWSFLRTDPLGD